MKTVQGSAIIDEALTWVGTPYVHLGRAKGHAIDCIGLILETLRACGTWIGQYREEHYGPLPGGRLKKGFAEHAIKVWVRGEDPDADLLVNSKEGDIALIAWRVEPQHVAFLTRRKGSWYMIHANGEMEKVVYHHVDAMWLKKIVAVYRLAGVE